MKMWVFDWLELNYGCLHLSKNIFFFRLIFEFDWGKEEAF